VQNYSKPIRRVDDASKRLIMELLQGLNTYGFDVDSIFYIKQEDLWVVIEFLKTDHPTVRPSTSHPNRYWHKNWRKFVSLWSLVQALGKAELYLVNYEDKTHAEKQGRREREFHVIKVRNVIPGEKGKLIEEESKTMNLEEIKKWYQTINQKAKGG